MTTISKVSLARRVGLLGAAAATVATGFAGLSSATADAAPDTASGRVTASSLTTRVGPSTHVSAIQHLGRGRAVTIVCKLPGTTVDGNKTWYQFGSGYWASARYVKITSGTPRRCQRGSAMGTTTTTVNVRQAPSQLDTKRGSIRGGVSTVDVFCKVSGGSVGNNTFWYATAWGDGSQTVYLHSEYVKVRGTVRFCGK